MELDLVCEIKESLVGIEVLETLGFAKTLGFEEVQTLLIADRDDEVGLLLLDDVNVDERVVRQLHSNILLAILAVCPDDALDVLGELPEVPAGVPRRIDVNLHCSTGCRCAADREQSMEIDFHFGELAGGRRVLGRHSWGLSV